MDRSETKAKRNERVGEPVRGARGVPTRRCLHLSFVFFVRFVFVFVSFSFRFHFLKAFALEDADDKIEIVDEGCVKEESEG